MQDAGCRILLMFRGSSVPEEDAFKREKNSLEIFIKRKYNLRLKLLHKASQSQIRVTKAL